MGEMVEADVFGGAFLVGEVFEKHEMSFVAQIRAENYGRLLAEGPTRFADRYGIPTEDNLVSYLLSRGARDPALAGSLAKAMRHFWHHDTAR
ncbi:hypothetical protein [Actinoplanes sp. GCM10030250]|uniref:hypothetical protein n=1 Tax=Actinoplanes sp. GCM10030250 TaxID=3273376 RepID=UPI00360E75D8